MGVAAWRHATRWSGVEAPQAGTRVLRTACRHPQALHLASRWLLAPACPSLPPAPHRALPSYRPGDRPPAPRRNFQAHWAYACEGQWRIAFLCFSLGIPVFFVNMALAAWIKAGAGRAHAQAWRQWETACWAGVQQAQTVANCSSLPCALAAAV